jgi:hypothetical protein
MKPFSVIVIIIAITLTVGFSSGGLAKSQTIDKLCILTVTGTIPSGTDAQTATQVNTQVALEQKQVAMDNSIFSWPNIILLGVAVIGIVAFRRNSYV